MSAEVIPLPSAMTVEQRQAANDRKRRTIDAQNTHDLLRLAEQLRRVNEKAARAEAKRVAKMVVPFGRPRRRRTKPMPPSGPRPAA